MEDDITCSICVDPLTAGLVALPCGHVFHKRCIDRCEKRECPLCRKSLKPPGSVRELRSHLVCDVRAARPEDPDLPAGGGGGAVLAQIAEAAARMAQLKQATDDAEKRRESTVRQKRELESRILQTQRETSKLQRTCPAHSVQSALLACGRAGADGSLPASAAERKALLVLRCNELLRSKLELSRERNASAQKQLEEARLRVTVAQLEGQLRLAQEELRKEERGADPSMPA